MKAERLLNSRFTAFVSERKSFNLEIKIEKDKPVQILKGLPDRSSIDEFILTFRFFIQKKEATSFRAMGKIYERLQISSDLKKQFLETIKELNRYLDSTPSSITIKINNETPTNRDIMLVFIYGKLAHADPKLEIIFDQWAKNPLLFSFIELEFNKILNNVFRLIQYTKHINEKAIEELSSSKTSQ